MKRATTRLACLAVILSAASCATLPAHGPSAPFAVAGAPVEATIWVDDHLAGTVTSFAGGKRRIATGFHRLEIRYPGYYSQYQELDVKEGLALSIRYDLRPVLP